MNCIGAATMGGFTETSDVQKISRACLYRVWAQKSIGRCSFRRDGLRASSGLHGVPHLQDLLASLVMPAQSLCPRAGQTRRDPGCLCPFFDCFPPSPLSPTFISFSVLLLNLPDICFTERMGAVHTACHISGFPPTCTDFQELSGWPFP